MKFSKFREKLISNKIVNIIKQEDTSIECEGLIYTFENGEKFGLLPSFEVIKIQ